MLLVAETWLPLLMSVDSTQVTWTTSCVTPF
jgi:hypothetical protein